MRRSRSGALALLCALGLIAAACGDDDDQGTSATAAATTAATAGSGASTTGAASTTAAAATGTTTAASTGGDVSGFGTAKLSEPGTFGVSPDNDALYVGAGGFQLDTSQCPSDYDSVQGITDKEIRLGISLPKSGPLAGFGLIADGMNSYFKYVNEQKGGIGGRQIVLDVKDDAYEPARTKTNVDQMLQSGDYAAFTTILGTPNNLGVWDEINDECMPQILNGTGAAQWGDVENHPWTTGMQLDYFTEARLWAEWLKQAYPNGVTVAALTYNSDFGQSYAKGFKAAIKGTNIQLVSEELHDANAPNLTNQFTSLAASNAQVLLIETTGAFCTQAMGEVEKGSWKPVVMMSVTCQSLTQFFQPLIDQGLTGQGTHIVQYLKDVNDPADADDPFVKFFRETVSAQGLDPKQSTYATGWVFAWYTAEILNLASKLEGGLNRPNIIVANRSMDSRMPLLLDPLIGKLDGLKDAYLTEGGRVAEYKVTDPKQLGTFQQVSPVIDLEGQLGTYATVAAAG